MTLVSSLMLMYPSPSVSNRAKASLMSASQNARVGTLRDCSVCACVCTCVCVRNYLTLSYMNAVHM